MTPGAYPLAIVGVLLVVGAIGFVAVLAVIVSRCLTPARFPRPAPPLPPRIDAAYTSKQGHLEFYENVFCASVRSGDDEYLADARARKAIGYRKQIAKDINAE